MALLFVGLGLGVRAQGYGLSQVPGAPSHHDH